MQTCGFAIDSWGHQCWELDEEKKDKEQ